MRSLAEELAQPLVSKNRHLQQLRVNLFLFFGKYFQQLEPTLHCIVAEDQTLIQSLFQLCNVEPNLGREALPTPELMVRFRWTYQNISTLTSSQHYFSYPQIVVFKVSAKYVLSQHHQNKGCISTIGAVKISALPKLAYLGGNVNLLRVNGNVLGESYHFKLAYVHYVKSTKKILAGVRSPSPFFWHCQDFDGAYS